MSRPIEDAAAPGNSESAGPGDGESKGPGPSPDRAPTAHKRKIARLVAAGLAALGFFVIAVCAFSWFGLSRFQSSLSQITGDALPRVLTSVQTASRLSTLLVEMERLFRAETGQGQSKARQEIGKIMDRIAARLADKDETAVLPQLESVGKYLDRLAVLAEERLLVRERLLRRLSDLDELVLGMQEDLYGPPPTEDSTRLETLRKARTDLLRLIARTRWSILADDPLTPGLMERDIARELAAIRSGLPLEARRTRQKAEQTETLLLGENGLVSAQMRSAALGKAMSRLHDNSRDLVLDLIEAQSVFFNTLTESSVRAGEDTEAELKLFTRFFLSISAIALLAAVGIHAYFRKAFILRLEKLNAALIQGVHGELPPIDISGTDEIADIARAVEYFARELKISSDLAQASNKAKSAFIANMSHEFRTPMNAVIGFTRMVLETDLTPRQRKHLEKIENSAHLLLGIINDILDFSRLEAGKLEVDSVPFAPRDVIDNLADAYGERAGAKGLRFTAAVATEVPESLRGDPPRLFQVLNSLCDNALKFSQKGEIRLEAALGESSDERVTVLFSVSDQGIGMTEEQLGRLFQPFTQGDVSSTRRFGGTGLGLTISKSLCELMGGSITAGSEYGKGSVFTVALPFGRAERQKPDGEEADGGPPDLHGLRLMIAEDNPINQEIMLALLEKTGAEVDTADNGKEALDMLRRRGGYNLVLMDIQMPEMDGLSASRAIRAMSEPALSGLPIVAMTAHAAEGDRQMCLDAGMNDHIAKPIAPEALYAALRRWTARG